MVTGQGTRELPEAGRGRRPLPGAPEGAGPKRHLCFGLRAYRTARDHIPALQSRPVSRTPRTLIQRSRPYFSFTSSPTGSPHRRPEVLPRAADSKLTPAVWMRHLPCGVPQESVTAGAPRPRAPALLHISSLRGECSLGTLEGSGAPALLEVKLQASGLWEALRPVSSPTQLCRALPDRPRLPPSTQTHARRWRGCSLAPRDTAPQVCLSPAPHCLPHGWVRDPPLHLVDSDLKTQWLSKPCQGDRLPDSTRALPKAPLVLVVVLKENTAPQRPGLLGVWSCHTAVLEGDSLSIPLPSRSPPAPALPPTERPPLPSLHRILGKHLLNVVGAVG